MSDKKAKAVADVANFANTILLSDKNLPEIAREANSIYLSYKCSQATVKRRENPYKVWFFPTFYKATALAFDYINFHMLHRKYFSNFENHSHFILCP